MDLRALVEKIWREGRAILAVNAVNLETAQAVRRAAELLGEPMILQISKNAARYAGLEELAAIGQTLKHKAQVPLFLHLDHGESLEDLERAFQLGFDSAMLEAADLPLLQEARKLAGPRPLEVELEAITKGERPGERLPLEALRARLEASRADWVAVDLGTVHKDPRPRPLDLERLRALASLGRPFALHGGSSAEPESLRAGVALGVAKVNLATLAFRAFTQGLREALPQGEDPRTYLAPAREAMAQALVDFHRRVFPR